MCMLLTEREPLQATLRTAYGDDTQIPAWMKGYLTAAALAGIGEGEESFRASDAITVTFGCSPNTA